MNTARLQTARQMLQQLDIEQARLLQGELHVGPMYFMLDKGLGQQMRLDANKAVEALKTARTDAALDGFDQLIDAAKKSTEAFAQNRGKQARLDFIVKYTPPPMVHTEVAPQMVQPPAPQQGESGDGTGPAGADKGAKKPSQGKTLTRRERLKKKLATSPAVKNTPPPRPTVAREQKRVPGFKPRPVLPPEQRAQVRDLSAIKADAVAKLKAKNDAIDWGTPLIEFEAATLKNLSQADYDKALENWHALQSKTAAIMAGAAPVDARVTDVVRMLIGGPLRKYVAHQASLTAALLGDGGNCEAQTKMLVGLLAPYVPNIGLQRFSDHVQAVTNEPARITNVLTNKWLDHAVTHIYSPRLIAFSIAKNEAQAAGVSEAQLLMREGTPTDAERKVQDAKVPPGDSQGSMLAGRSSAASGGVVPPFATVMPPGEGGQDVSDLIERSPSPYTRCSVEPSLPTRVRVITTLENVIFNDDASAIAYESLESDDERADFVTTLLMQDLGSERATINQLTALYADPSALLERAPPDSSALRLTTEGLLQMEAEGYSVWDLAMQQSPAFGQMYKQGEAFLRVATANPRALSELESAMTEKESDNLRNLMGPLRDVHQDDDVFERYNMARARSLASITIRKGVESSTGRKEVKATQPRDEAVGTLESRQLPDGDKVQQARKGAPSDEGVNAMHFGTLLVDIIQRSKDAAVHKQVIASLTDAHITAFIARFSPIELAVLVRALMLNGSDETLLPEAQRWTTEGVPATMNRLLRAADLSREEQNVRDALAVFF